MDFLGSLINDRGCSADGSTSSNPIMNVVDHMLQSMPMGGTMPGMYGDHFEQGEIYESPIVMPGPVVHAPHAPWEQEFSIRSHSFNDFQHMNASWENASVPNMSMPFNPSMMYMNMPNMMPNMMVPGMYPSPFYSQLQHPMSATHMQSPQEEYKEAMISNTTTKAVSFQDKTTTEGNVTTNDVTILQNSEESSQDYGALIQEAWASGGMEAVESKLKELRLMSTSDKLNDEFKQATANQSAIEDTEIIETDAPTRANLELAWNDVLKTLESNQYQNLYNIETNSFKDDINAFEKGLEYFRNGEISSAIQCFESAVAKDSEYSEAWSHLGVCHAENDDDKRAISCFLRARDSDPYNLEALLQLGTSYVNEMDSLGALDALRSWVVHHPKFHGIQIKTDEYSDGSLMDEVTQLMLEALAWAPDDADTLVVLGVLYNVTQNFDSAVSCFEKALAQRPDDYSLWNKIGATLANSNRSLEAVPWYAKALEARPRYVRGWLNLGISYANVSKPEDAAKSYLQALKLNPSASHIWTYLRTAFRNMNRLDLVERSNDGDVEGLIRLVSD